MGQVSAFDPEAQGDNGAMVITAPGRTSTLQPSSYVIVALPPGPTITESPTLAVAALVTGLKP
jgi:hypothetical protein